MAENESLLDREIQREILRDLRDTFTNSGVNFHKNYNSRKYTFNICYLAGHDLCKIYDEYYQNGQKYIRGATITSKGIDFLEGDGGLSAILNVVTVRLDADTIRALLIARVDQSDLPAAEKSALTQHLAALSETALKAATTHLVGVGLSHLPQAIGWLQKLAAPA